MMRCKSLVALVVLTLALTSCGGGGGSGSSSVGTLEFSLDGIPDLGNTGHFQAWIKYGEDIASLGKFRVVGSGFNAEVKSPLTSVTFGTLGSFTFEVVAGAPPSQADAVFITFEHDDDRDSLPTRTIVLVAPIDPTITDADNRVVANLTVNGDGIGAEDRLPDFSSASGSFSIYTPTDDLGFGDEANESLGLWFVDQADPRTSLLDLPALPRGWTYQGWIAAGGDVPVSLGRFQDSKDVDDDYATYPGRGELINGPISPGQDFVSSVIFPGIMPQDLTEEPATIQITVEPFPDNALAPFLQLTVLSTPILDGSVDPNTGVSALTPALELQISRFPSATARVSPGLLTLSNIILDDLDAASANMDGEVDPNVTSGTYEMWATINGLDESIARFLVLGSGPPAILVREDFKATFGNLTSSIFDPSNTSGFPDVVNATRIFITIEPEGLSSSDGKPSPSRIISGSVNPGTPGVFNLTVTNAIADFRGSRGSYFLTTPTDNLTDQVGFMQNDAFGCWFPVLDLPELPAGWIYEGFITADSGDYRLSTGKFRSPQGPDQNRYTSQTRGPDDRGFFFPGEDFVTPQDTLEILFDGAGGLLGSTVFITVEPDPDNDANPFFIQPLTGFVPPPRIGRPTAPVQMGNTTSLLPSGTLRILREIIPTNQ